MRAEARIAKLEGRHSDAPRRIIPLLGPGDPDVEDWPDRVPADGVRAIRLVPVRPGDRS